MKFIYLDHSATEPLLSDVKDEMVRIMDLSIKERLGNPNSLHTTGSVGRDLLNEARSEIAKLIEARPLELIFTSGGSESNNTVINTFRSSPIFISSIEHPSVLNPAQTHASKCTKIPVDQSGIINLEFLLSKLEETVNKNPKQKILVSVMLANNEVGTIEPIKEVSEIVKDLNKKYQAKIYIHTDATQAIGKIPVSVKELGVNYLTFTAHKIGGPIGIGALYIKPGSPFLPLISGGAQENKRRAGTSNTMLASGFKIASKIAKENINKYDKVAQLRNYLNERLHQLIPDTRTITPLLNDPCLPNILNVAFPFTEGESTQLYLDLEGIEVSTGSACASGDLEPSHVLMALYHDAEIAHSSVRFSLGQDTSKEDIDSLLRKLPPIIKKIQDLSTLTPKKD